MSSTSRPLIRRIKRRLAPLCSTPDAPHIAGMSAHSQPVDTDKIESADGGLGVSIGRILQLLMRPELSKWRPIMVLAILLTLAAAVLEVLAPILLGLAVDKLVPDSDGVV